MSDHTPASQPPEAGSSASNEPRSADGPALMPVSIIEPFTPGLIEYTLVALMVLLAAFALYVYGVDMLRR